MNVDDFREVAKQLESPAWAGGDGLEPFVISIAVSLKRIADTLEAVTVKHDDGSRSLAMCGTLNTYTIQA